MTFNVANEVFRVSLTSAEQIAAARAAQNGGRAKIPNGRIVSGMQVNTGWSWHLEDVSFAETTIEICDGRPSDDRASGHRVRRRPLLPMDRDGGPHRRELIARRSGRRRTSSPSSVSAPGIVRNRTSTAAFLKDHPLRPLYVGGHRRTPEGRHQPPAASRRPVVPRISTHRPCGSRRQVYQSIWRRISPFST